MRIVFSKQDIPESGALVAFVAEGRKLGACGQRLDKLTKGSIARALEVSRFRGAAHEFLTIVAPHGIGVSRVVLAGIGAPAKFDILAAQALGGQAVAALNAAGEKEFSVWIEALPGSTLTEAEIASHIGMGAGLRAYRFDKYKTKEKPEQKPTLKKLSILAEDPVAAKRLFDDREKVVEAVNLTRDLVSEPANVLFPAAMAAEARKLTALGVKVEILGEKEMKRLGMRALLGVGQGSEHESQLAVMQYLGAKDPKKAPIAFVGKGVTFDTGGISIKPAQGMEEMKWDMAGAGAVVGLMRSLAARGARVNAVGVIGLVENMPSGSAQRPGDIVTSMSGQTIEVLNTDAEGRLVLADALWYAQENFKPSTVIDLATLTGAIIISLGHIHAGLFSNDDQLSEKLLKSGQATGELLWRLPLANAYNKLMDSPAADVKNISNSRGAGSIVAAEFLQRFIQKGVRWAHLDIAGMAWSDKDSPTGAKGATGFGVRLLDDLVAKHFEDR